MTKETKTVLKKVASARGALAELKGVISSIPNENILIETPFSAGSKGKFGY